MFDNQGFITGIYMKLESTLARRYPRAAIAPTASVMVFVTIFAEKVKMAPNQEIVTLKLRVSPWAIDSKAL